MKKNRPVVCLSPESKSNEEDTLKSKWRSVVRRRSFLHGVGAVAAVLPGAALFAAERPDRDRDDD
jgi:hypothetical protein